MDTARFSRFLTEIITGCEVLSIQTTDEYPRESFTLSLRLFGNRVDFRGCMDKRNGTVTTTGGDMYSEFYIGGASIPAIVQSIAEAIARLEIGEQA